MSDVAARILTYIGEELAIGEHRVAHLDDTTPLLGRILDSMAIMRLCTFLEEEFGLVLEDEDLATENFRTIRDIEVLIQRKDRAEG